MVTEDPENPLKLLLVGTQSDLRSNVNMLLKLMDDGQAPVSETQALRLANKMGAIKYVESSAVTCSNVNVRMKYVSSSIEYEAQNEHRNDKLYFVAYFSPGHFIRKRKNYTETNKWIGNGRWVSRKISAQFNREEVVILASMEGPPNQVFKDETSRTSAMFVLTILKSLVGKYPMYEKHVLLKVYKIKYRKVFYKISGLRSRETFFYKPLGGST